MSLCPAKQRIVSSDTSMDPCSSEIHVFLMAWLPLGFPLIALKKQQEILKNEMNSLQAELQELKKQK